MECSIQEGLNNNEALGIRALMRTVVETCIMSKEGKVHERVSQAAKKEDPYIH